MENTDLEISYAVHMAGNEGDFKFRFARFIQFLRSDRVTQSVEVQNEVEWNISVVWLDGEAGRISVTEYNWEEWEAVITKDWCHRRQENEY